MSSLGKFRNYIYVSLLRYFEKQNNDEMYLKVMFFHRLGYWPNFKNPKTFNEKLQWLKLHDHNPLYTVYADKYAVRPHIRDVMGDEYLIPILGVYESVDNIDFNRLPDQFVLKCNHGASFNIICKDKRKIDIAETKKLLKKWMMTDFYNDKKEYHYKDIKRCIICEKYMKDDHSKELMDYKFFCIGGKVRMIQVDFDRFSNHRRNLYDKDWKLLDVELSFPRAPDLYSEPPAKLSEMIRFAELLSKEFPQVRIDFFYINDRIYFGEMTFFSGAGFSKYKPRSFERKLGGYLILPKGQQDSIKGVKT